MDTNPKTRKHRRAAPLLLRWSAAAFVLLCAVSWADAQVRVHLTDGRVIEAEEVWEDGGDVWFRLKGMARRLDGAAVRRIERVGPGGAAAGEGEAAKGLAAAPAPDAVAKPAAAARPVRIYLVGGALMDVDSVTETADGLWFSRANISSFLGRERVERIEREPPPEFAGAAAPGRREYRWSTGNSRLDSLIRENGARYGVDPYLIFCVMEQESHFREKAVSPAGARGLMQLMPGTARRFGVSKIFDPAQNISAGTRYLRMLLGMFGGRVDLVLAGYNAGEGAVVRYGHAVPPYRETRNYVKRIGERYRGVRATARVRGEAGVAGGN